MNTLMKFINHTARCITFYRGTQLHDSGLKGCQHAYIYQICKNPGISQDQIAKNICVNKSSVTRQINSLEQNGFAVRRPSETDKRVLHIYPTEKAEEIFPQVRAISKEWNEKVLEDFTDEERAALMTMLERVMQKADMLVQPSDNAQKTAGNAQKTAGATK